MQKLSVLLISQVCIHVQSQSTVNLFKYKMNTMTKDTLMRDLKAYDLSLEHQKSQLRLADNYRLSQTIEDHNKQKLDWRDLLKPFNRSQH